LSHIQAEMPRRPKQATVNIDENTINTAVPVGLTGGTRCR